MVIKSARELKARYHEIRPGDVFIGLVSLKHLKHAVLIDLIERGVNCLPSALCQVLNSSKVSQAFIFKDWMLPQTRVINRRMDLIKAINEYNKQRIGAVISKQDRMHCGHGIRRWQSIESLYSHMALCDASYPFVLQPYLENFTDIRVIIVGEYVEAYIRQNPHNFRVNISSGGKSRPVSLNTEQEQFCRSAMERGKFPYAHLDVLIVDNGRCYLSEIALNGGTQGARISREELDQKKQKLLENTAEVIEGEFANDAQKGGGFIDNRK